MTVWTDFEGLGFKDRARARSQIEALLEPERQGLALHLKGALEEAADPERVLVRLEHFLEACDDGPLLLDAMAQDREYTRLLCRIFDHSQYLTDLVCRTPEYITWLWVEGQIDPVLCRENILDELRHHVGSFPTFASQCEAMRRFKRREILRIGARDIFGHAPIESVTEDLTNLADAMLEVALEKARDDLAERYGTPMADPNKGLQPFGQNGGPREATFVVMAMGKLGGRELNFSSDIDLVFVYSDEGETQGGSGKPASNSEYFHKLGERIIKALSEQTAEGHVFRVDVRLRPHGSRAPLAVSLGSAVYYYEIQGQPWERQALIKARPAAGHLDLGREFIERTRPFVFPRYFDDDTLEEIRLSKRQLEAQVAGLGETEIDVKLGHGGIRDIEFTVQMLQLLNGGRNPELRDTNTLKTIAALEQNGLLSAFEAMALARNYAFLRQVEHRLQIEGSQQRHTLPGDPDRLDDFGRRLGYQSGTAFMAVYRDRAIETREILERFFATEGAGHLWISELLNPQSEAEEECERLTQMGFKDCKRVRDQLQALYTGPGGRPHTAHVRQLFRTVVPVILDALTASPNPDVTLVRLGQMLANLRAPGAIYDILKHDPELCDSLVTLVSNSPYLADCIIRDPGLFEAFGYRGILDKRLTEEALDEELALLRKAQDSQVALYRLRDGETLYIGLRELLRDVDVVTVGRELTMLAELCLREVLLDTQRHMAERHGLSKSGFAVVGFGKLAGAEMSYGSDLDLVFVHGTEGQAESGMGPAEYSASVAAHLVRTLKEPTRYGTLYDVDTRLRPDGKRGALTASIGRLKSYYAQDAQAWERMALVKARVVAGDEAFGQEVGEWIQEFAFMTPLTRDGLLGFEDIRKRLAAKASPLDLKTGEGGIAEIEFAARLLQMRHGKDVPELRRGDVLGALDALKAASLLSSAEEGTLREAYLWLRRVENRIRMLEGRPGSALPEDPEQQRELAARLNENQDIAGLAAQYKKGVHRVYTEILKRVTPS